MADLLKLSVEGGSDFRLQLEGAPELLCAEIVRHVPGKRLVCRGTWSDQEVFAKVFIGMDAGRYAARDARGAKALSSHRIPTPALLFSGNLADNSGHVLVYAAIGGAYDAETLWSSSSPADRAILAEKLVHLVAQMHDAGLVQTDLYMRNFLYAKSELFALDGDGIRISPRPIAWNRALPNLALLLSKFDVEDDQNIPAYLAAYARHRNWQVTTTMLDELAAQTASTRLAVARKYARKKVLRNCTDVLVRQDFDRFMVLSRKHQSAALQIVLETPDAFLDSPGCRRLKNGNTCTVGLVDADGRKIVIKRYNIKSLRHGLGRLLRPTRAAISWSNAHLLGVLGIATAAPMALLERRWGPMRREGYFLAEFVEAPDVVEALRSAELPHKAAIAEQVARLMHRMYLLGIEHGDCKAANLKIVGSDPLLIDLDAMRLHRRTAWFERRHARDIRRLLKNWQDDEATLHLMKNAIEAIYGPVPFLNLAGL